MESARAEQFRWSGHAQPVLLWAARVVVGAAFLWSAAPKLVYPDRFFHNVLEYGVVDVAAARVIVVSLPWLEAVLGMALLSGFCLSGAMLLATGLLSFFAAIQVWALSIGLQVGCGCFSVGHDTAPIGAVSIGRTVGLAALCAAGLWCCSRLSRHRPSPAKAVEGGATTEPCTVSSNQEA
jgi:cobalt-zinc-cadmium efflux system protein